MWRRRDVEPIFGLGYHPGNFIGPLAFDVIVCPGSHLAFDLQVGYWSLENNVRGLGIRTPAPMEVLTGMATPYIGAYFATRSVVGRGKSRQ